MSAANTTFRVNATDPTETLSLRRSFESAFNGRIREVRGEAREVVPRHAEGAPRDARLLRRLRNWLASAADETLVERVSPRGAANGDHWTAPYVRDAYDAGLRLARRDMRDLGVDRETVEDATRSGRAEHQEHLARELLAAYYGTEDAADTIREAATDAVYQGVAREDSKTALRDRVLDSLTAEAENQTAAHAQTVVVETVNEALLTSFEVAGVTEVGVAVESEPADDGSADRQNALRLNAAGELEWITAGDDRVCPDCAAVAGETVQINDVRDRPDFRPPLHPRCRCRLVPTAMETSGETAEARQGDREQVTIGEGSFARRTDRPERSPTQVSDDVARGTADDAASATRGTPDVDEQIDDLELRSEFDGTEYVDSPLDYDEDGFGYQDFKQLDTEEVGTRMVDLEDLNTSQTAVTRGGVRHYADNPGEIADDTISVFDDGDELWILDGNHRTSASRLRGDDQIEARIKREL